MVDDENTTVPQLDPTASIGALAELVEEKVAKTQAAIDNLEKLHDRVLHERDRRYGERFDAAEDAVKVALREAREAAAQAVMSQKEAVDAAFEASEKAITKAEVSIQSKADVTFVKLEKMQDMMADLMRRSDAEQRFTDHLERMQGLGERITRMESVKTGAQEQRTGMHESTRLVIAIGGFAVLMLTFFLARGGL